MNTPLTVRVAMKVWAIVDVEVDMSNPSDWQPRSARFASDVTEADLLQAVENNWEKISVAVDKHLGADAPEVEA